MPTDATNRGVFLLCCQVLEACGWRLRHLDVSDCTGLTDASLRAIGERCGVLESFKLGMCPLFTSGAIQEVGTELRGFLPGPDVGKGTTKQAHGRPVEAVLSFHSVCLSLCAF